MICVTRDLNLKTQPSIPMSEENESHPEENKQNQEPLENDNIQAESNEEIHDEVAETRKSTQYIAKTNATFILSVRQ